LFPLPLEQQIASDNEIRFVDAFVDSLDLGKLGFRTQFPENGRPAYHPKHLLKLYIYGYLNGIRSSRKLEKECHRNIEVLWLIESLKPDHNTISNFRRDNPKAIKRVFRETVRTAKNFNLIGGHLIAGDSTKLRAQNSKKNNYNAKKIARHIAYIDKRLAEHENILKELDGDKNSAQKQESKDDIDKHKAQKKRYQKLEKQLKESGQNQISTSDPDSRHLIVRSNITEVAYNVQSTVDAEHKIPIDYKVSQVNDKRAMGNMVRRAKTILHTGEFTALYDKGYHTGEQFYIAQNLGVETHVAIPSKSAWAPDPNYNGDKFRYNIDNNTFTCPQGNTMTTTGTWHKSKYSNFQQFKTNAQCLLFAQVPKQSSV
ncbi:MAG: transposase, partial [Bacteroidia bacterium]